MSKSILTLMVMATLFAFGCGGDDDGGPVDAGPDVQTQEDAGPDAGDGGPTCVTDTTTLPAQATVQTNLRFLNQCTESKFRDFDNVTRIAHPLYVPGGPYPPLTP